MSPLRLTILIWSLVIYQNGTAQQNSLEDSTHAFKLHLGQISKVQTSITKYNTNVDSTLTSLQDIPSKYFKDVNKKIDTYSNRITSKTEKTLIKLSKWENKIKNLLDKTSPETSARLFGKNQVTFTSVLKKLQEGKDIAKVSSVKYDEYRDKLTTNVKYIQLQKNKLDPHLTKSATNTLDNVVELNQDVANTEAVEKIIKERKKLLINESIKYIGKSKYLSKINKESYYYVETLKNYKQIFSDPEKTEQTVKAILNKIPAFKRFFKQNSMLASIFGGSSSEESVASLDGLQSRSNINEMIQSKIAAGGPNASEMIQQNLAQAQAEMKTLKDKVLKAGGGNSNAEIPDFKPNRQKSKTFFQRLEYGVNYQFGKSNKFLPPGMDIALTVGYKLNDKSLIGIGLAYKLGLGTIDHIHFSSQGIGIRSFIDWKLKKQFFITGGFEFNYNSGFQSIKILNDCNKWQQAGLIGISKKLALKTKFTKGTKLSLLYDALHKQHIPVSQPIIFRIGYNF